MLYNPDCSACTAGDSVFSSCCKLLAIKEAPDKGRAVSDCCTDYFRYKHLEGLGNNSTLNNFIFENGMKRAAVKAVIVDGVDGADVSFLVRSNRTAGQWTPELSKTAAVCRLMLDCAVRQETAEDILKQAAEKKEFHFVYEGLEKKGYNMRFHDWPEFYDRMNSEFQVLEQPRSNWMLEAQYDKPIIMPHRVGDVWSQDSSETLDTMTPLQLYDISKQKGVGNMFEHGVVGELVKTYDATAMVQTYISDMEVALDRLGRIIFLFYWKPQDFASSYGTDDQSALENKLLSNFKSLGELTLELIQKARDQQEGTVSLT